MEQDLGRPGGLSSQATEPEVSALRASIPDAVQELVSALQEIVDWKPREFEFPADWSEQIEACPECRGYADHPIQRGICDTHRRPLWEREAFDSNERSRRGSAMWLIAESALQAWRSSAQGMAARSGETGTGSTEGNSPVGSADAPTPPQEI